MGRRPLGRVVEASPGVWKVQASIGTDPLTGRRRRPQVTVHGSRADAERALARMLSGHHVTPTAGLTVATFFADHWLPHKADTRRPRTADGYAGYVRRYIVPAFGHVELGKVTPMLIDRWLTDLAGQGLSERTRLHCYRILRAGYRQAVRWRLIDRDPTDAVEAPSPRWRAPDVLDANGARRMLTIFDGTDPVDLAVAVALGGGLRRSEVCGLDWTSVDLATGDVTVVRGRHGDGSFAPPKSAQSHRTVTLAPWATDRLRAAQHEQPRLGLVVDQLPNMVTRHYRQRLAAAGWGDAPPMKNLRHSHATLLLGAGVDLATVSQRLGHAGVNITAQFYLSPSRAADRDVAQRLGDVLAFPSDDVEHGPA